MNADGQQPADVYIVDGLIEKLGLNIKVLDVELECGGCL